ALYADEDWPREAMRYAAMVTMLDRQVGEIVELLRELGLEKNTLVLVGGDNGGDDYFKDAEHPRGFHGPNVDPKTGVAFRGRKRTLYDGGLRIPMVAHWPGRIEPGRVSDHRFYFPDFLPTVAELAGAEAPEDVDGISIVPELLGSKAAGREQEKHEYLYWEYMGQTAVRAGPWKLVRLKPDAAWGLYAIDEDVAEEHDVAADHPEVVAKLAGYAAAAHEPAREGTFVDRTAHEKDRRAKWGEAGPPRGKKPVEIHRLPESGLISREGWKVLRVSSESTGNGRLAKAVLDGDPRTFWHTRWMENLAKPPHELVIDMGSRRTVRGFVCLARQDGGWNGAFGRCEFHVGDDPAALGGAVPPAASATFEKTRKPQRVDCAPVKGRYLLIRIRTEAGGGPWASMAEIGVVGE
ncbi:MAG: sulfatase/phosphatase domain-containing protein, partial [Planctomycetota bacterium]